jgi:hypothetical protein
MGKGKTDASACAQPSFRDRLRTNQKMVTWEEPAANKCHQHKGFPTHQRMGRSVFEVGDLFSFGVASLALILSFQFSQFSRCQPQRCFSVARRRCAGRCAGKMRCHFPFVQHCRSYPVRSCPVRSCPVRPVLSSLSSLSSSFNFFNVPGGWGRRCAGCRTEAGRRLISHWAGTVRWFFLCN